MSIIVVSGYRRSGTSMMMNALYSGMSDGCMLYAPDFEGLNPDVDGYKPNPNGLFEVGMTRYLKADFLRDMPDGSIVKILYDGLPNLPAGDYVVIFMHRDVDEIKASVERSDAALSEHSRRSGKIRRSQEAVDDRLQFLPFCSFRDYDQTEIDHVLGIMDMRKDVKLIEVNYADVIANPEKAFKNIAYTPIGRKRINVDIEKAAAVIDPSLHRIKSEEINVYSKSRDAVRTA